MTSMTDVTHDAPQPGERCTFHAGCCDPDDMTCPGTCTAEPCFVFVFSLPAGVRRQPLCPEHLPVAARALYETHAAQRGGMS